MPKYASYDKTTPSPHPVIGWHDTDRSRYPVEFTPDNSVKLNDQQWIDHHVEPADWAVQDGHLISYRSPHTIRRAALVDAGERRMRGLTVTFTNKPELTGTYAFDRMSVETASRYGVFAKQFGVFPNGSGVLNYPDSSKTERAFGVEDFISLMIRLVRVAHDFEEQHRLIDIGGTPTWPEQNVTIP